MPVFTGASAVGLAGEYLVGVLIAKLLGWPYRMQPIADLGIDGEIEILDAGHRSTGRLLKVQCKSSSNDEAGTVYVQARYVRYWRDLGLPVLVVRADLMSMEAHWWPASAARPTAEGFAYHAADAKKLGVTTAAEFEQFAVERDQQFDPLLGLLNRIGRGLGVLDYTPPQQLEGDFDLHIQRLVALQRTWDAAKIIMAEVPELRTARANLAADRFDQLFKEMGRRMAVAGRYA